jgi:5-methylthioadenosine/S-adenosylhomocysteine deaminase
MSRRKKGVLARGLQALLASALLHLAGGVAAETLLIKNALIMTMKPGDEVAFNGYLAVDAQGRISAIGEGAPPKSLDATEVYDAQGKFVIPGFVSAHSHIWQSAFRGLAANQYVRGWVDVIYGQMAIQSTPEDFYWFTLHGCLDHLAHGVTSMYNFTYGRRGAGKFAEEQWRGQIDCGARFIHSYARSREGSSSEQRDELARFMDYVRRDLTKPTVLKVSLAGTSQPREAVELDRELMKQFGLSNETHYLEWPLQKEQQQSQFKNIVDANILGPDFAFGHFIHTTDAMLKTVAAAGSGMVWNPLSNGRLASGIADIPKYLSLGVKVGMGVDGQASADLPDPFENMRMGLYMIRAKYESALVLQPIDVLRMHTLGGAQVLDIDDKVGSLEVGKFGDLVVVDPRLYDRAPVFDPYATLVFACNTMNIDRVYVGGKKQVQHHEVLHPEWPKIQKELDARVTRLRPPQQMNGS